MSGKNHWKKSLFLIALVALCATFAGGLGSGRSARAGGAGDTRKVYGYAKIKKKFFKADYTTISSVIVTSDDKTDNVSAKITDRNIFQGGQTVKWEATVSATKDERGFTATAELDSKETASIAFQCKKATFGDAYHAKPDIIFDHTKN